jgi:hypothetical protein
MRFLSICTMVVAALLAGCSGNGSSPSSSIPGAGGASKISQAERHGIVLMAVDKRFAQVKRHGFHGRRAPQSEMRGIYTAEFTLNSNNVIGYPKNNSGNGPSICSESTGASGVNGIGVDRTGNLIVPMAYNGILIYQGPAMCGPQAADIPDALGQAVDAAANDALSGTILVGHANAIAATCTISSNNCTQLTASNMLGFVFVAMDKAGNCYATALDVNSFTPALWYWAGCTGTGAELGSAQGFTGQSNPGGIDVDSQGNLVVLQQGTPSSLTVFSGCRTGTCTVVSGPTALNGAGNNQCVYGHLGRQNRRYACGDYTLGQVDVYSYLPSRTPSYLWSFNNGLDQGNDVSAASYSPSSKK